MTSKKNIFLALLSVLVPMVFSPCLGCQFLNWDDYRHFISNPCVYSLSWYNLSNLFHQTINDTYIPLTTLSFNLEYHLFGASPLMAHLINVLLHLAVVLMIFDFACKLGLSAWESFVASAIFAFHPMHVESVAWVTERKDVLGILFYVCCLQQYWLYLQRGSKKHYGLSVLFGFLSILTKAMAVSIPWVLLLLDWYHQRRRDKTMWLDKFPFALLIFPVALITFCTLSPHPQYTPGSVLIGLWTFSWYLEKFFLPMNFLPAYTPALPVALSNLAYQLSGIVFIVFLCSMFLWRQNRLFIFACLFWMATIFFFWRFDFADSNIVADRFMYLPSLGFCLWLGKYLSRSKAIAGIVIIMLAGLTFNQCGIWKDDLTLWTWDLTHDPKNVIAKAKQDEAMHGQSQNFDFKKLTAAIDQNPLKAEAYLDRGVALQQAGDYFLAFNDFDRTISLDPANDIAYIMRGQLFALKGENKKALDDFDKAITLKTTNALAYVQKAEVLRDMHHFEEALTWLDQAARVNPSMGAVYFQRGLLYKTLGEWPKAIDDFSRTISLKSNLKDSYCRRAESYQALQRYREAQEDFKRSLKQDPDDVQVLNELGIVYLRDGNFLKAMETFDHTIAVHPFYDNAYINRGIIYLQQKKYELALKDYTKAISLELYPYHALITRGDIYFVMGNLRKALKDYDLAILFSQGDPVAQMKRDHLKALYGKIF